MHARLRTASGPFGTSPSEIVKRRERSDLIVDELPTNVERVDLAVVFGLEGRPQEGPIKWVRRLHEALHAEHAVYAPRVSHRGGPDTLAAPAWQTAQGTALLPSPGKFTFSAPLMVTELLALRAKGLSKSNVAACVGEPRLHSEGNDNSRAALPGAASPDMAKAAATHAASSQSAGRNMVRHLRWLAWLHYALAIVTGAMGYQGLPYVRAGKELLDGKRPPLPPVFRSAMEYLPEVRAAYERDPPLLGMVLILCGAALIVLAIVHAGLLAYIGRLLQVRRRWTLCLVFSALDLMYFPPGTALGTYALLVLTRPEVRAAFGRQAASAERAGEGRSGPPAEQVQAGGPEPP